MDMSTNARPAMLSYLQANPQVFVVVHGDLNSMKFNPFPHFLIFSFASLETTHAFPDIAGPLIKIQLFDGCYMMGS